MGVYIGIGCGDYGVDGAPFPGADKILKVNGSVEETVGIHHIDGLDIIVLCGLLNKLLHGILDELKAHYQRGGLGDVKVKKFLIKVLEETLSPIRERRHMWEARIPEVYEILRKGSEVAAAAAADTLHDVRAAMRINYFDDQELINQPYEQQL